MTIYFREQTLDGEWIAYGACSYVDKPIHFHKFKHILEGLKETEIYEDRSKEGRIIYWSFDPLYKSPYGDAYLAKA